MECDSDSAWTCRALLQKENRASNLETLKSIVTEPDVRQLLLCLERPCKTDEEKRYQSRVILQLLDRVATHLFGLRSYD